MSGRGISGRPAARGRPAAHGAPPGKTALARVTRLLWPTPWTVTGLCDGPHHVAVVRDALQRADFPDPALRVITHPAAAHRAAPAIPWEPLLGEGAGLGLGGAMGAAAGWAAPLTDAAAVAMEEALLASPWAGVVAGMDPVLVTGAAVGAVAGGLLGTHAGASVAVYAAEDYERRVATGAMLVRVEAPDWTAARRATRILAQHGAQHVRCGIAG